MRTRLLLILGFVALLGLVVLLLNPVRNTVTRLGILLCVLVPLGLAICQTWKTWQIGKATLVVVVGCLGWGMATLKFTPLPRDVFARSLKGYLETPYVWGGETKNGIDCSGLIRMAMRDAYFSQGQFGAAMRIWFFDSAAKDLAVKYQSVLEPIGQSPSIAELDSETIPIGSVAVTDKGVHTLAYLGNGHWIQASPDDRIVNIKPASAPDSWFGRPVFLFRLKSSR